MAKFGKTIKDVIRGDTRVVTCTWFQQNNTTPIDLTGGTAYFTVNVSDDPESDSDAAIQKTADTFTDPTNGEHTFTLDRNDTNIDPGEYWYDAEYVGSDDTVVSSYRGKFIIQSDTTRS